VHFSAAINEQFSSGVDMNIGIMMISRMARLVRDLAMIDPRKRT
jgi:hypothetical protein